MELSRNRSNSVYHYAIERCVRVDMSIFSSGRRLQLLPVACAGNRRRIWKSRRADELTETESFSAPVIRCRYRVERVRLADWPGCIGRHDCPLSTADPRFAYRDNCYYRAATRAIYGANGSRVRIDNHRKHQHQEHRLLCCWKLPLYGRKWAINGVRRTRSRRRKCFVNGELICRWPSDVILMRPSPFDTELSTRPIIWERAEEKRTLIVNKPQSSQRL